AAWRDGVEFAGLVGGRRGRLRVPGGVGRDGVEVVAAVARVGARRGEGAGDRGTTRVRRQVLADLLIAVRVLAGEDLDLRGAAAESGRRRGVCESPVADRERAGLRCAWRRRDRRAG